MPHIDLSKNALQLIESAKLAGCDAVKFQKRTINIVYDEKTLDAPRESPWGNTTEDQKKGLEFSKKDFDDIDSFCKKQNTPIVVFMGGGYSNPIDHTVNAVSELFYQCRDFTEQFKI